MSTQLEQQETVGLTADFKKCSACDFTMRLCDNYCRSCGRAQARTNSFVGKNSAPFTEPMNTGSMRQYYTTPLTTNAFATSGPDASAYTTAPLPVTTSSLSQKLVASVVNGVQAELETYLPYKIQRTLVAAVLSIPIWLIIVLLSPLDAYLASKNFVR